MGSEHAGSTAIRAGCIAGEEGELIAVLLVTDFSPSPRLGAVSEWQVSLTKEMTPVQIQMLKHEASSNTADADPVNLVATTESVLKHSQEADDTKHLIRQQVTSLLLTQKPRVFIPRMEQDALRTLIADRSIVILPADKGRSTIVLDKLEYLRKANALLDDRHAYLGCDGDPMKKLVAKINVTLAILKSNGAISKAERLTIKPTDSAMVLHFDPLYPCAEHLHSIWPNGCSDV
ncbi:unnamed protein product [Schistocephalus solidus]|uniref:Uncharacterized protein n=1 Tax=Schistocephalus solidus TaxID=70667 RepID=A0A183SBU7_SCHSO|nr:unnamed protein product [Schistocephalus solidus]